MTDLAEYGYMCVCGCVRTGVYVQEHVHVHVHVHLYVLVGCCLATKVFIGSYPEAEVVEEVMGWLGLVGTTTANKIVALQELIGMHLPMQLMHLNSCHGTIICMYWRMCTGVYVGVYMYMYVCMCMRMCPCMQVLYVMY